jgi:putative two-component system response regulator
VHASERRHRILIADDDEGVLHVLTRLMEREQLGEVHAVSDSRRVLPLYFDLRPDIVLLDVEMPRLDGLAVLKQIRSRQAPTEFLPIIVISGKADPTLRVEALRSGATDFIAKPFDHQEVTLRVREALRTRGLTVSLEDRISERTEKLKGAESEAVRRLAMIAELRDYADGEHPKRVGDTSASIAAEMGFSEARVELVRAAAPLHDIGKIAIPEEILLKPGALTLEEFDIIQSHTTLGARLLGGSDTEVFQLAEEIALYHHENWDGTGYTPGLAGEAIPVVARIVTVADVFDALTHDRPYKRAWTWDEAVQWISEQAGQKFDPAVVEAFREVQSMRLPEQPGR